MMLEQYRSKPEMLRNKNLSGTMRDKLMHEEPTSGDKKSTKHSDKFSFDISSVSKAILKRKAKLEQYAK